MTNIQDDPYMKKPAKCANLVHKHFSEKMWTFCQNSNKSTTNHTFLEKINHIAEISKSVTICYICINDGLFLQPHYHKLAIYSNCGQFK